MGKSILSRVCPEFRRHLSRRDFFKAGFIGTGGLTLPNLLRLESRASQTGATVDRTKSVIILWMRGGPSQIDMWDPKPDAPEGIRGEFSPIPTSVPDIRLSELLPLSARAMNHWSLVRSLAHREQDGNVGHSDGDQICFTGYPSGKDADVNAMPSCGSYVAKLLQQQDPGLPAYVMIPRMVPGTGAAWLGKACAPFETMADPAQSGSFVVPNLGLVGNVCVDQLQEREKLLRAFDKFHASDAGQTMDRFQAQALDILTTTRAKDAFDLDREPDRLKERYGLMPGFEPHDPQRCGAPNWAQRMLLARRLVEAGVRLVTVDLRWWDFHKQGFDSQRRGFLPRWDRAYTALIEDLHQRGLLESTLVVAWGEMGRTPNVNKEGGRDHWPYVMSAALAGGGVKGGRVVGCSDQKGGLPRDNPKRPHDVLATMYRHLGVDTSLTHLDHMGRPHQILPQGTAIDELF